MSSKMHDTVRGGSALLLLFGTYVAAMEANVLGPPATEVAIEEFILKERALSDQRRHGQLAADDWNAKYTRLIESEAQQLQGLMPGVLDALGKRLSYRSKDDMELDALLDLKHPTAEDSARLQSLLQAKARQGAAPLCGLAFLTGYLGRSAPGEAVEVLLASIPAPERSEDMCLIRALMLVGPAGYRAIAERMSSETDRMRAYSGVMALVASTKNTDFPGVAGLGKQENWDASFPTSIRALRRLNKKWESWWNANENKYTWNPDTSLLEAK